jgi:ribosomal subunit interface protein
MNTVTFHDVEPSPAVQSFVEEQRKLLRGQFSDITSCRVTVGRSNKHHRHGDVFEVRIELHVPRADFIAERTSGEADDVYATLNAAFADLRGRLQQHFERARERRNEA